MDFALTPEIIVAVVTQECARISHYSADDMASDLITAAWMGERKFNDERHFRRSVRKYIRNGLILVHRRLRRQKNFTELIREGMDEDERDWLDELASVEGHQFSNAEANRIKKISRSWPLVHRKVVLILADGGNVLDIAEEIGVDPWHSMRLLGECRNFLNTGHSLRGTNDNNKALNAKSA